MQQKSRDDSRVSHFTHDVFCPFILAWHFLTAIPISRSHHEPSSTELATSMAWYSTVGLLIGGLLAAADQGLRLFLTAEVVNVLLIILLVLLTRGLHQDGLADTLDGLAGGRTAADRLRIMRDPSVGALGATGLFLSLLLRYAGLLALPQPVRLPVLLCMPALGRWACVALESRVGLCADGRNGSDCGNGDYRIGSLGGGRGSARLSGMVRRSDGRSVGCHE